MKKEHKQIAIFLCVATLITTFILAKRNKNKIDEYDYLMW